MSTTTTQLNVTIKSPLGKVFYVYHDVDHSALSVLVDRWDGFDITLDTVTIVSDSTTDTVTLTPCPYDHAHTSSWCGHAQCRQS